MLFVQKQPNAAYRMMAYAQLILEIVSPLKVISKNREYFLDSDFPLPCEFHARLGDPINVS